MRGVASLTGVRFAPWHAKPASRVRVVKKPGGQVVPFEVSLQSGMRRIALAALSLFPRLRSLRRCMEEDGYRHADRDETIPMDPDHSPDPRVLGSGKPSNSNGSSEADFGEQIGPYRLRERIGTGGMGEVFIAEQSAPVQRLVALKIVKAGMDSREVLRRFEAERQALALLDHPWIAHVYDAGTAPSGRPYFVMELVDGSPITEFCDRHKLSVSQRLELFVKVCEAVQHAHQRGIIHRDLKPPNILVEFNEGNPIPKVIDFGLAKAMDQELSLRTMATQMGDLLGTPQYMSPEQALGIVEEIDTRSDVYSLGVIFYELLTGEPPISREEIREAGLLGLARLLDEKEPERPSSRLKTSQDAATTVAENRNTDVVRLDRCLRRELDWIALKCLEKEKGRRYESASSLARDIERHLHDEVVEARPPSLSYRWRKAVKRNRSAFAAAVAVLLAILTGSGVAAWQAMEAHDARRKAEEALASETKSNRRMEEALASETKSNERLQARLLDLVGLQKVTQSIVSNDPDRFVAKSSKKAIVPGTGIQAALFLGPGQLVLAQGSEVLLFDLERREEIRRFQFGERITALFAHSSDDHFLTVGSGWGQTRQSKIYLVPVAEGNDIECVFKSTDMKGLAYPVAFARGPERGTVLMAVGYDESGNLGFERELPGNPEQSPESQPDNDMKTIAVFRFEIDSRKVVLEGTAENFGRGGWDEVRTDVAKSFPAFAWPKAELDEEVYRKLKELEAPELKSGWAPLAHWEDQWAAVVLMKDLPEENDIPAENLRLYDANSGELDALPNRSPGREALDLGDHFLDAAVCDARSQDYLSPTALAGLEMNRLVYHANVSVDGRNLILKAVNLNEFDRNVDRQTFLQSFQLRLILDDTTTLRKVAIERGYSKLEQHPDLSESPGDMLHVGLEGDVIFYVGRFRTYQGILVYDGHSGKVLYEVDSDTLGLSGANMIGDSFMETNGRLLVATQPGLLRVWRDESGKWVHSIERHP